MYAIRSYYAIEVTDGGHRIFQRRTQFPQVAYYLHSRLPDSSAKIPKALPPRKRAWRIGLYQSQIDLPPDRIGTQHLYSDRVPR